MPVKDLQLFVRALTHSSYVNESSAPIEDNERLEFLGDAVLDFVVGAYVYDHFPEMKEGQMTRMRSGFVRTEQLADFARQLDLGPALRLGRGELASGGHERETLLCDAFESFVGALYLDAGILVVEKFVLPFLDASRDKILSLPGLSDPKTRLQEWAQSQKMGAPIYLVVDKSGPEHARIFEVVVRLAAQQMGRGKGSSKAAAEQAAAQAALNWLGLEKDGMEEQEQNDLKENKTENNLAGNAPE